MDKKSKIFRLAAGYFLTTSRFAIFVFVFDGLQEEISEVAKKKTQALELSELTGYGSKELFPGCLGFTNLKSSEKHFCEIFR